MTIYVDELREYPRKGVWCHMITDGPIAELHEMADRIGMKRSWFQNNLDHPHYDLRASKQALAIQNGAILVTSQELIEIIRLNRVKAVLK